GRECALPGLPHGLKTRATDGAIVARVFNPCERRATMTWSALLDFQRTPSSELRFLQRDRADVLPAAGLAAATFPEGVELVEDGVDQSGRLGPDTQLEVA